MFTSKYFNVGQVVVTKGINEAIAESGRFSLEVSLCLTRYCVKDWGTLSEDDRQVNEEALQYPDDLYLLGVYQTSKGKIYIITNRKSEIAGDNVTTVCFPEER